KADITPMRKVTPAMERITEDEHFNEIRKRLKDVVQAWNEAVSEVRPGEKNLEITPEREQKIFELRTWGRSADADGRELATSQCVYESIRESVKDSRYTGPKLDLRQNRELHEDALSALVQVKYRNSSKGRYGEGNKNENHG